MTRATGALAAAGLLLILAGLMLWQLGAPLDRHVYESLHLAASSRVAVALTDAGSGAAMIPIALGGVLCLALIARRPAALWLFGAIASGRMVLELTKAEIGRARPDAAMRLVDVTSASFPSSHSAGSMLTMLALCAAVRAPRVLWLAGAAFSVAVGLSRIALGVHWPSDVLAGWGSGMLWVALWMTTRPLPAHPYPSPLGRGI